HQIATAACHTQQRAASSPFEPRQVAGDEESCRGQTDHEPVRPLNLSPLLYLTTLALVGHTTPFLSRIETRRTQSLSHGVSRSAPRVLQFAACLGSCSLFSSAPSSPRSLPSHNRRASFFRLDFPSACSLRVSAVRAS